MARLVWGFVLDSFTGSLAAVISISLLSLTGLFFISLREETVHEFLFYLVSFACGAIFGVAFFDLIPESIELTGLERSIIYIVSGFVFFYFLERSLYWFHGHGHLRGGDRVELDGADERLGVKSFAYLNLVGDGVHNLIDGMIVGASFIVSVDAGFAAALAVAFHELPQEIGDFAVLLYGGLGKAEALIFNFITALTAVIGALIVHFIFSSSHFLGLLIGFAGGGFTYISAAELIPELQRERSLTKSGIQFLLFIFALFAIWSLVGISTGD
ncbi:MAG: ZIP family metal transporter [Candidatus Bathyarchaeia archaeon]